MDATMPDPSDDRVTLGDLLLDDEASGGVAFEDLRHRALEVLAGRALSGHQAAVDEVGRQHLVYDIEVLFGRFLQETTYDGLVLLLSLRHRNFSSMPTYVPYQVDTMSMMPLGGVRRIDRKPIHPSAWNSNSRNFAFWGFSEVRRSKRPIGPSHKAARFP